MYEINPPPDLLQQGDVLKNIPFVLIPPLPLRIAKPFIGGKLARIVEKQALEDEEGGVRESALVDIFLKKIMVISQTCDILNRETIAVCPVYSVQEYKTRLMEALGWDDAKAQKRIDDDVSKGKTNYLFYLPPSNNFPAAVVDFQHINTVNRELLKIENRVICLSDFGRNLLSYNLAAFFSRPAV